MKKKLYEKPSTKVYETKDQPQLLAGSGLGAPSDYPEQPDPFNF